MKYYREPENFERTYDNYLVIGYYRGKAIVKDEMHQLYFIQCEEALAPIGTIVEKESLEAVGHLRSEEQIEIEKIYGNKEN